MQQLETKRQHAKERVEAIRGFYIHALITIPVLIGLFIIDAVTGGPWWFLWPLIGMGIALAFHALGVYGRGTVFGSQWEERKINELMGESSEQQQRWGGDSARATIPKRTRSLALAIHDYISFEDRPLDRRRHWMALPIGDTPPPTVRRASESTARSRLDWRSK